MLSLVRNELQLILNNIDSGNSNITEDQLEKLLDIIKEINSDELSRVGSADYIGVCPATFKNYIDKGLIPEGHKKRGFTELFWYKTDLNKFLKDGNVRKKLRRNRVN